MAEGPSLYIRRRGSSSWETMVDRASKDECLPHAAQDPADASVAVVFSIGCDADLGALTRYDLRALRGNEPADPPATAGATGRTPGTRSPSRGRESRPRPASGAGGAPSPTSGTTPR